jgi:hypothetical protein
VKASVAKGDLDIAWNELRSLCLELPTDLLQEPKSSAFDNGAKSSVNTEKEDGKQKDRSGPTGIYISATNQGPRKKWPEVFVDLFGERA